MRINRDLFLNAGRWTAALQRPTGDSTLFVHLRHESPYMLGADALPEVSLRDQRDALERPLVSLGS